MNVKTKNFKFTESSKAVENPNRGFYYIYTFEISDEDMDYNRFVNERYRSDTETKLTLVEINLQNYRNGKITQAGLSNIEALFEALKNVQKQLIVRFLYDWDGKNMQNEPASLDIILTHMEQLENTMRSHSEQIFTYQGLFVGNWGEMNGSKFLSDDNLKQLISKFAEVTDVSDYLSVRTPAYWRMLTQVLDPSAESLSDHKFAGRMGLFNDGMLGSESDYGTYGAESVAQAGRNAAWKREDELKFQDKLCRMVPNGGEVINSNKYNDFDRAVRDFSSMHVTYLNRDYDKNVFHKWEKHIVTEQGCFHGMNGLDYIDRHLGFRLFINDVNLKYQKRTREVSVAVNMKNAGFAPIYSEAACSLTLYNEESGEILNYDLEGDLRELSGGNDSDQILPLRLNIPVRNLEKTKYKVYVSIVDTDTNKVIELANEQEEEAYGYCIGTIEVE